MSQSITETAKKVYRHDVVSVARRWVAAKTPWQHQASLCGVGTDCIGLIAGVARECGIKEGEEFFSALEYRGYGRQPDKKMLLEGCDRWMDRISLSAIDIADVLVFRFERDPQHFAILSDTDPYYIIHAYAQARKVVENRFDDLWRSRCLRAYRFRGIS